MRAGTPPTGFGDFLMTTRSANLVSILERMEDLQGSGKITLGELIKTIGQVSFAPLLIVPAIALATPLSGIPLFSSIMGVVIFLVSVQMLMRRDHLWLPQWLLNLKTNRDRVRTAFEKMHPVVAWLDRRTQTRLTILTHRPLVFIPQLICVLSGLFLPVLEFVPFSSSMVGVAVALLGIAMFARDGALLIVALLPYVAVGYLIAHIV